MMKYTLRTFAICPAADHQDGSDDHELIQIAGDEASPFEHRDHLVN